MPRRNRRNRGRGSSESQPTVPPSPVKQSITFAALLAAIVLIFFPVRFDVSDDHSVTVILRGSDGFPATAHVPFMSRPLTALLYGLYQLSAEVPWLGIGIFLTTGMAIALLARVLFFEPTLGSQRNGLFALLLPLLIRCLYRITFTSAALLLEVAGVVYLFAKLRQGKATNRSCWIATMGFAVAYAWRWKLSLYFLVFAAPAAILSWKDRRRTMLACTACLLALVFVDRVWNAVATGESQREYQQAYRLRGQFHDLGFARPDTNQHPTLKAAGWNLNDYRMFHDHWMLYDSDKVHPESLRKFLDEIQTNRPGLLDRTKGSMRNAWNENQPFVWVVLFGFIALLSSAKPDGTPTKDETTRPPIAIWPLMLVIIPCAILAVTRFVPRVSLPATVMLIGTAAWSVGPLFSPRRLPRLTQFAACCLAFLAAAQLFWNDWQSSEQIRRNRKFVMERVLQIGRMYPGSVVVRMQPGFGLFEAARHPLRQDVRGQAVRIVPAGWQVGSSHYHLALKQLGVKTGKELLRGSVNNKTILFFLCTPPGQEERRKMIIEDWQRYVKQNIDPKCRLRTMVIFNEKELRLSVFALVK